MSLVEQVYSVLIVSSSESFNASMQELLPESKHSPVKIVSDIGTAKRTLLERGYDFVIINASLPDESITRFSIDACSRTGTVVLLLVKSEAYDTANEKVSKCGVFVLSKPITKSTFVKALNWLTATRERLRSVEKKTVTVEEKMEEIRYVNRAKWLLIDCLKMTEPEAHRYIEKQAMDRCVSKREVSEIIIKTYS